MENQGKNIFNNNTGTSAQTGEENIFASDIVIKPRLNGMDVTMLNETGLNDSIDDKTIELGLKISKLEEEIDDLRNKIAATERLGKLQDVVRLKVREKELVSRLNELKSEYSKHKSLIKPVIRQKLKKRSKLSTLKIIQRWILRKILAKLSKKLKVAAQISESLDILHGINRSVDELIEMKVPYGENAENYRKLTSYLYRANKVHAQILRAMNRNNG